MDSRTCAACGLPVAASLRGYPGSIRACDGHLAAWRKSPERTNAMLDAMGGTKGTLEAFEQWAARVPGGPIAVSIPVTEGL